MAGKDGLDFGSEMAGILPVILRHVVRNQGRMIKRESAPSHGCIAVIDLLSEQGVCRMSHIASILNLTMGAATGIIDKMVTKGFVKRERSDRDRRVVEVTLLKKGREASKQINDIRCGLTNEMYSVLTEDEKKIYLKLLKKVCGSLKR